MVAAGGVNKESGVSIENLSASRLLVGQRAESAWSYAADRWD